MYIRAQRALAVGVSAQFSKEGDETIMLSKPKYMIPSTNMQECVVDLNLTNVTFSCIVDGNDAISAWQIKIYTLADNALILDTGKQVLSSSFFPVDIKNKNVPFEINIKNHIPSTTQYYRAGATYDDTKKYYTRSGSEGSYTYKQYTYGKKDSSGVNFSTEDEAFAHSTLYYISEFKNLKKPYYWTISFWNEEQGSSDTPTVTSTESVFYANTTVVSKIQYGTERVNTQGETHTEYADLTNGTALVSSKYYFKATYSQSESVGLKRYGWRIKDTASDTTLLDTISHNQIYGTAQNIQCFHNGFLNGGNYSIEAYIETQNGAVLNISPIPFTISYDTVSLTNDFKVAALKNEPGIMLDWREASIVYGEESGGSVDYVAQYPIVDYAVETPDTSVHIPNGVSVIFNYGATSDLDISEKSMVVLSTQIPNMDEKLLFSAEGTNDNGTVAFRRLYYRTNQFVYEITDQNGVLKTYATQFPTKYRPNKRRWYIITMYPYKTNAVLKDMLRVVECEADGGLYPKQTLYPSETLYPRFADDWLYSSSGGVIYN